MYFIIFLSHVKHVIWIFLIGFLFRDIFVECCLVPSLVLPQLCRQQTLFPGDVFSESILQPSAVKKLCRCIVIAACVEGRNSRVPHLDGGSNFPVVSFFLVLFFFQMKFHRIVPAVDIVLGLLNQRHIPVFESDRSNSVFLTSLTSISMEKRKVNRKKENINRNIETLVSIFIRLHSVFTKRSADYK